MATIKQFEDLEIWISAREMSVKINNLADLQFKKNYSLIDQIKRSSGSIMDNIAEGFERDGNKEFIQFLYISKASVGETRSQLYRALDLKYINDDQFNSYNSELVGLSNKIGCMINYLKNSPLSGKKYNK